MKFHLLRAVLTSTLAVTGCTQYSTVSERPPTHRSDTASGRMIGLALRIPAEQPQVQIGRYLDAVASAAAVLERNPTDPEALADYNFAVSRIFGVVDDARLDPWKRAIACPGAGHVWKFSLKADARPERSPANFKLLPADRYQFKGKLVGEQARKEGLGAPLVAVSKIDATVIDPFAQGKHVYYGMTGLVEIKGRACTASLVDPLSVETARMTGRTYPLAANFSAPIALAMAELEPRKKELRGLFKPEKATAARLARLQPYDPKKIPILCVHGLGDSHATWAPMIESLRADPVIRENYQIWFFSYPTGYPYPVSAATLRKQMDAISARYPDHKEIVVLGHSMGGMISRTLITDSGTRLWDAIYDKPPAEMAFSKDTRKALEEALIFEHRKDVSRVIFLSPSHRGSETATNFLGRLGSKAIGGPQDLAGGDTSILTLAKPASDGATTAKMPNSVDFLDPQNRFVKTLAEIPPVKGVPYHTILGDRGKGGNLDRTKPVSTDGLVAYWSGHLPGALSEIIVPSDHWTHRHPQGIAEVKSILYQHVGRKSMVRDRYESGRDDSGSVR